MRYILPLTLLFCSSAWLCAATATNAEIKAKADSLYAAQDFAAATQFYAQLPRTATVCYNTGNAYYRMDSVAQAILWYERAASLSPSDRDIAFNLNMARANTIDKIVPRHDMFFVSWWRAVAMAMSADAWAGMAVVCFAVSLALALMGGIMPRGVAMGVAAALLFVCVVGNLAAFSQRRMASSNAAVVMDAAATVKSTPATSGNDLFVIHEGTRVEIKDATLSEWTEVELSDGKVGWIQSKQIEKI